MIRNTTDDGVLRLVQGYILSGWTARKLALAGTSSLVLVAGLWRRLVHVFTEWPWALAHAIVDECSADEQEAPCARLDTCRPCCVEPGITRHVHNRHTAGCNLRIAVLVRRWRGPGIEVGGGGEMIRCPLLQVQPFTKQVPTRVAGTSHEP